MSDVAAAVPLRVGRLRDFEDPPAHIARVREIVAELRRDANRRGPPPRQKQWLRPTSEGPARDGGAHLRRLSAGLRAAGLEPSRRRWNDGEIVQALRACTARHGRPPLSSDWRRSATDHPTGASSRGASGLGGRRSRPPASPPRAWNGRASGVLEAIRAHIDRHGRPPSPLRLAPPRGREHPRDARSSQQLRLLARSDRLRWTRRDSQRRAEMTALGLPVPRLAQGARPPAGENLAAEKPPDALALPDVVLSSLVATGAVFVCLEASTGATSRNRCCAHLLAGGQWFLYLVGDDRVASRQDDKQGIRVASGILVEPYEPGPRRPALPADRYPGELSAFVVG
jgi:hypothetical protein